MSDRSRAEVIDLSAQRKKKTIKGKASTSRAAPARGTSSRAAPPRKSSSRGAASRAPQPAPRRQSNDDFQFMRKQSARKARIRRNRLILLAGFLIIVAAVIGINLLLTVGVGTDTFYEGIKVDGLDLKGYTKQEAIEKLYQLNYERLSSMQVKLTFEDNEYTITGTTLGAGLNIEEQVELAWEKGREGNVFKRQSDIGALKKTPYYAVTKMSYDYDKLVEELTAIKAKIDIPAVDATMDFDPSRDEKFRPVSEQSGRSVQLDALLSTATAQLDAGVLDPIAITTVQVEPKVFRDDLVLATSRIKRVTTPLGSSKKERIHNIKLALSKFNGMVIAPGEEISFNAVTGPRGLTEGYQNAGVILDDEITDGPGGGVCQVSTTLYQALVRSGLQIVKRSKHSLPVSYVPVGTDAAVAYDYMDLVFKNNSGGPIYLICEVIGSDVSVTVHGRPLEEGVEIKIVNDIYETIPAPEPELVPDTKSEHVTYTDETFDLKKSREGYRVRTYAVWYKDGEEAKRENLYDDYYKESAGKRYVGILARSSGNPSVPVEGSVDGGVPVIGGEGG